MFQRDECVKNTIVTNYNVPACIPRKISMRNRLSLARVFCLPVVHKLNLNLLILPDNIYLRKS